MAFWNLPLTLQPKQQHKWVISFVNKTNDPVNQFSLEDETFFLVKATELPSFEIGVQSAKYLYSHNFNFPKKLIWKPITITFYDALIVDIESAPFKNNIFFQPIINPDDTAIIESYNQDTYDIDGNSTVILNEENGLLYRQSTQSFFYSLIQKAGYYNPEEHSESEKLATFKSTIFKKELIENFIGENTTLNITQLIEKQRSDAREVKAFLRETWRLHNPIISDIKFDKLDYSQENIPLITITVNYDWADFLPSTPEQYAFSKEESERLKVPSSDFKPPKTETWVERNIRTIEERQKAEKENKARIDKNISDLAQRFGAESDRQKTFSANAKNATSFQRSLEDLYPEPTKSTAIPAVRNPADSETTRNITRNLQNAGVTGPITVTQGGIAPSSTNVKPNNPSRIKLFPPFDKE